MDVSATFGFGIPVDVAAELVLDARTGEVVRTGALLPSVSKRRVVNVVAEKGKLRRRRSVAPWRKAVYVAPGRRSMEGLKNRSRPEST